MLLLGGTPALAGDTEPVTNATGLTERQVLGRGVYFKPVFGDEVKGIRTLVNGANPFVTSAATARATGVLANFTGVADDTDADVTVQFFTATDVHTDLTTRVHTDFVLPSGRFSPGGGIVHDITTITASGLSDDVAAVVISRAGAEIDRATAAPWQLTWDTNGWPVDSWATFKVIDKAGNVTVTTNYFTIDNQGPAVDNRPRIVRAGQGFLSAWIHDVSGVDRVEWWVNGTPVGNTEKVPYDFGTTSRVLDVVVKARDLNGHESTTPFQVTVDADAPAITSATPADGTLVRGSNVTATLSLQDVSGVLNAIPYNGWSVSDSTSPYVGMFTLGKDGVHTLKWWVEDYLSQGRYVYQTVLVDNTRPTLAITSGPKNGAKVKGTVKVGAKATDRNGVARVELWINGKRIATDYRSAYAFSINSAKYGKKFKIQLRAYDRAGNSIATSTRTWHR
ncbi:Ig-like domain-containing protein [Actinoplanes sp. HUAS TT8]|uniref:Ig-like domain-containing protein n=1 Tax=Actinoplanes sp. HUAS TT8 TaxID=3447453 RepID=UPI003F5290CB